MWPSIALVATLLMGILNGAHDDLYPPLSPEEIWQSRCLDFSEMVEDGSYHPGPVCDWRKL